MQIPLSWDEGNRENVVEGRGTISQKKDQRMIGGFPQLRLLHHMMRTRLHDSLVAVSATSVEGGVCTDDIDTCTPSSCCTTRRPTVQSYKLKTLIIGVVLLKYLRRPTLYVLKTTVCIADYFVITSQKSANI